MSKEAVEWLALAEEIERIGLRDFVETRKHLPELKGRRIIAALRAAATQRS